MYTNRIILTLSAAIFAVATWTAPVRAGSLDDRAIVGIYNQVNNFDIETALLGLIKGHSKDVRELATVVLRDHTGVRQGIHQLAVDNGFAPALPASRHTAANDHYAVIAMLREANGEAFDKAYLLHEIAFHEAAIKAVKDILLPSAKSAELKSHFEQVLPAFEHHLSETRRVAQKLGYVQ